MWRVPCAVLITLVAQAVAQDADPLTIVSGRAPEMDAPSTKVSRPAAAGRVVHLFDFEERSFNATDLPMYWVRAQHDPDVPRYRPGFPRWNHAALDYSAPAARGEGSVRLPTDGGSTSLRLDPGVLPVFPGADYTLTSLVRTEAVHLAHARMSVRQLTADGAAIDGTELATDPIQTLGAWRRVNLRIANTHPDAAFLQIDLELLQPRDLGPTFAATANEQDFSGAAWFDDVAIAQAPRIGFTVTGSAGITVAPDSPEFELSVRDLTGDALAVRLVLYDAQGSVIDTQTTELGLGRAAHKWAPHVDRLGWYRCNAEIFGTDGLVASAVADALVVPPLPALSVSTAEIARERARLAIWSTRPPLAPQAELPDALTNLGVGAITLPFWTPDLTRDAVESTVRSLADVESDLRSRFIDVGVGLVQLPGQLALATGVDTDDPLGALAASPTLWEQWGRPLFEQLGATVDRWSIGVPGSSAGWRDPVLRMRAERARSAVASLAPSPRLVLGWTITDAVSERALGSSDIAGFEVLVPHELPPSAIRNAAELWADAIASASSDTPRSLTLVLESQRWETTGAAASAADLARRALEALCAFEAQEKDDAQAIRLAVLDPWEDSGFAGPPGPSPTLGVWRTLSDALIHRRPAGQWSPAPGVRALMLAPAANAPDDRTGAIAIWADTPEGEGHTLTVPLALSAVELVDLFANKTTLEPLPSEGERLGAHPLVVHSTPVIVEGVDLALIRFMASIKIDPPIVESASVERQHRVIVTNPWETDLTGRLIVVAPGGRTEDDARDRSWDIMPRSVPFALAPGEEAALPLTVTVSPGVEAGEHAAILDFEVGADRRYGIMRIERPLEVGLEQLALDLRARRSPDGAGLLIDATMTNRGDDTIEIDASAFAPGVGRERAAALRLGPGQTAVRTFAFPDAQVLRGQRISVGVADRTHEQRLNKSILID